VAKSKPKRFSEVDLYFGGELELVEVTDLFDKELMILDVEEHEGGFGEYVALKVQVVGEEKVFVTRTGGQVIVKKAKAAQAKHLLPLLGKIVAVKDYYDIQ
jgi:hypothetical protein